MSALLGTNQAPRVTTGFLNTADDPAPGVPLASPSGSIVQPYAGQVGGKLTVNNAEALGLSSTATGTLYRGVYRYVQFRLGATAANARGQLVFWYDRDNNIVTGDVADATVTPFAAGVCLMANTKGNYGWIQVSGKASVKFKAATTKTTPAIGDVVMVDATPSNTGDVLADATGLTSPNGKNKIGIALEAPVGGAVKLVELDILGALGA